ncbi:MAG: hypothetical protein U0165_16855 [Polyangiaceae bacterium]
MLSLLAVSSAFGATLSAIACEKGRIDGSRYVLAAQQAMVLGQLAREQYIHEAHTLLVRDDTHIGHHGAWVDRFQSEISQFRHLVPHDELAQLDRVAADSHEVAELFAHEIVPAVLNGDQDAARLAPEGRTRGGSE